MYFKAKLEQDGVFAGFVAASVRGPGEVPVSTAGYLSSEDGMELVHHLEQISGQFLRPHLPRTFTEAQVGSMLIVLNKDQTFEVWINQLEGIASIQAQRDIKAGEAVVMDDLADIVGFRFAGVTISDEQAYVLVFSVGWRKALLFDFTPMHHDPVPRDLDQVFGAAYAYLAFQERMNISETEWERFFAEGWFPFTSLPDALVKKMVMHAREAWPLDDFLGDICSHVRESFSGIRRYISTSALFKDDSKVLLEALDAFDDGKFAVAASALYPRIEGILRREIARRGDQPSPAKIVAVPTDASLHRHPHSLLLPARFQDYLEHVVFPGEDFSDPSKVQGVTRHSVAHGVAPQDKLDEKAAVRAILVIRHLSLLLTEPKPSGDDQKLSPD